MFYGAGQGSVAMPFHPNQLHRKSLGVRPHQTAGRQATKVISVLQAADLRDEYEDSCTYEREIELRHINILIYKNHIQNIDKLYFERRCYKKPLPSG